VSYNVFDGYVTAADSVSWLVTGINDVAQIGTPSVDTVTEDVGVDNGGNLHASGTIGVQDADDGQSSFRTSVTAADGDLGSLVLQSDGSYSYKVPNSAVQSLTSGQTKQDVFTVTSSDGTTKDVSFFIEGRNDAPVIDLDSVSFGTFNRIATFRELHVSDADAQSGETYSLTATTTPGTIDPAPLTGSLDVIDAKLETGIAYVAVSTSPAVETIQVTVSDSHGGSDSLNFIFAISPQLQSSWSLVGTTGKDVFFGSGQPDQFVFAPNSGHDVIIDFATGADKIDLTSVVSTNDLDGWIAQHVSTNGNDTLISLDSHDSITLKNVTGVTAADLLVSHPVNV